MQAEGALKAAKLNIEFTHVQAPITGRASRHLVSAGNLVQGSDNGASTLLTSIVSLDPIYIYFDMDEATYQKNSRLWFEGKRPSSRETANPVQVTLTGETKPSLEGKVDFLDNRLDVSTGTLRTRAVIPNKNLSILPGQFGRVRAAAEVAENAIRLAREGIRFGVQQVSVETLCLHGDHPQAAENARWLREQLVENGVEIRGLK